MKAIKPKKLQKGDIIGVISPASSPDDLTRIEAGAGYLEKLGFNVEIGKNVGKINGYLAGTDEDRVSDFNYMFNKKAVKAVFCVRGGYGSPRLLDKIDFKAVKNNPKIFVGYSDITALQMAIFSKTGLVTFAGPMLAVDFYSEVSSFTEEMFWRVVSSNKPFGKISMPDDEKIIPLTKGFAKGQVLGGNLALLVSLLGTEFFPPLKNKILLLEEIGELPYRIDRMLNQLRLAGIFDSIKGVILGSFIDCNEHDPTKKTLTLGEVIDDYFSKSKIPVVYNFKHGHIKDNITVPFGVNFKINTSRNAVEIIESAVS